MTSFLTAFDFSNTLLSLNPDDSLLSYVRQLILKDVKKDLAFLDDDITVEHRKIKCKGLPCHEIFIFYNYSKKFWGSDFYNKICSVNAAFCSYKMNYLIQINDSGEITSEIMNNVSFDFFKLSEKTMNKSITNLYSYWPSDILEQEEMLKSKFKNIDFTKKTRQMIQFRLLNGKNLEENEQVFTNKCTYLGAGETCGYTFQGKNFFGKIIELGKIIDLGTDLTGFSESKFTLDYPAQLPTMTTPPEAVPSFSPESDTENLSQVLNDNTKPVKFGLYTVQVASRKNKADAEHIMKQIPGSKIRQKLVKGEELHAVVIGDFQTKEEALKFKEKIIQDYKHIGGPHDISEAFVIPTTFQEEMNAMGDV